MRACAAPQGAGRALADGGGVPKRADHATVRLPPHLCLIPRTLNSSRQPPPRRPSKCYTKRVVQERMQCLLRTFHRRASCSRYGALRMEVGSDMGYMRGIVWESVSCGPAETPSGVRRALHQGRLSKVDERRGRQGDGQAPPASGAVPPLRRAARHRPNVVRQQGKERQRHPDRLAAAGRPGGSLRSARGSGDHPTRVTWMVCRLLPSPKTESPAAEMVTT